MESVEQLQNALIEKTRRSHSISAEIIEAFYKYPRHKFVPANYSLSEAYIDRPLALYQKEEFQSTISQPSFVLYLLELLQLQKGQKVFEVGTGSGWNAALMSYLVGAQGKVVTMEIIPELARSSREVIKSCGIKNILIIEGDAGRGWLQEAPYDRMIFTAAAPHLPVFVAEQLKTKGRVLFVKEGDFGTDEILLLEKTAEGFTCLQTPPCHFVSMTGSAKDEPNKDL